MRGCIRPPPGSGAQGFIPDSVLGNVTELVWGQPYRFVEVKARKQLNLEGNLKAMINYVSEHGGFLELYVRSAKHPEGATRLSGPLEDALRNLEQSGRVRVVPYP